MVVLTNLYSNSIVQVKLRNGSLFWDCTPKEPWYTHVSLGIEQGFFCYHSREALDSVRKLNFSLAA